MRTYAHVMERPNITPASYEALLPKGITTFKVLQVACAADACLNCWELRYYYDASEMYTSGNNIGHWLRRREESWRNMHKFLWPSHTCPDVLQSATDTRPQRGWPQLAPHFPHVAANTSLFVAILVWAVREAHRPVEHRLTSAGFLAYFINSFFEGNKLLPRAEFQVHDEHGQPLTVHVSSGPMCNSGDLLDGFPGDAASVKQLWWAQLIENRFHVSSPTAWLRNAPERCSLGELVAMCLMQASGRHKIIRLGFDIVRHFAGLVDRFLPGKLKPWAGEEIPQLWTPAGAPRRRDVHYKHYLASEDVARQEKRKDKVARRAEKEASRPTKHRLSMPSVNDRHVQTKQTHACNRIDIMVCAARSCMTTESTRMPAVKLLQAMIRYLMRVRVDFKDTFTFEAIQLSNNDFKLNGRLRNRLSSSYSVPGILVKPGHAAVAAPCQQKSSACLVTAHQALFLGPWQLLHIVPQLLSTPTSTQCNSPASRDVFTVVRPEPDALQRSPCQGQDGYRTTCVSTMAADRHSLLLQPH